MLTDDLLRSLVDAKDIARCETYRECIRLLEDYASAGRLDLAVDEVRMRLSATERARAGRTVVNGGGRA